jgi:hypothetical protein
VASSARSSRLTLLLGAGDGSFQAGRTLEVFVGTIRVAILDLDGDTDLATSAETEGIVSVLLNNVKGVFSDVARFASGGQAFRGSVADVDGDAQLDLVVANGIMDDVAVMFHVQEFMSAKATATEAAAQEPPAESQAETGAQTPNK